MVQLWQVLHNESMQGAGFKSVVQEFLLVGYCGFYTSIWRFPFCHGGTPRSSIYRWIFMAFPWNKPTRNGGTPIYGCHVDILADQRWLPTATSPLAIAEWCTTSSSTGPGFSSTGVLGPGFDRHRNWTPHCSGAKLACFLALICFCGCFRGPVCTPPNITIIHNSTIIHTSWFA